jgi:hypothetical protein
MKTIPVLALAAASLMLTLTTGCVVAPARGGAVYVAPAYASPGVGYVWERHPRYGWGWHSPDRGWDKGWR